MNKKISDIAFRIMTLILSIATGWILFPFIANLLIYMGLYPVDSIETNFGPILIQKVVTVWFITALVSTAFLFLKTNIRYFFLLLPIIAPSAFGIIYTLTA